MTELKCAQMRAIAHGLPEAPLGGKFWATPTHAKELIDAGAAELVNAGVDPVDDGILKRRPGWPFDRFSEIQRGWAGKTAVLIGGGLSLTLQQIEMVRLAREDDKVRVIAVNDAYLWAPWADINYFADSQWHEWHSKGIAKPRLRLSAEQVRDRFAAFAGQKCSIQRSGTNVDDGRVHILQNAHGDINGFGLSLEPDKLVTGSHSGFQALNLSILAGPEPHILIGYDAKEQDGGEHWHGIHPIIEPAQVFATYRRAFSAAENAIKLAGATVLNCSPGTAIDTFPKMSLADALRL